MVEIPAARITRDAVYIGGVELPGLICRHGVTVIPGGDDGPNILVVEFIVGTVDVEDTFP